MKIKHFLALIILGISLQGFVPATQQIYLLSKYHYSNQEQEKMIDKYLEEAYLPALHRIGIQDIGVFKTIDGRNKDQLMVMVLIPLNTSQQVNLIRSELEVDNKYQESGSFFLKAPYDDPPFDRIENILMSAFSSTPEISIPGFDTPRKDRIYELRSYESATPYLHQQKVKMFDTGESELFINLGFQPVFFASVFAGANMPNLMYLTCHANEEAQEENWNKFRESDDWANMKSIKEFENTVSKSTKWYLYPAAYSDY